MDNPLSSNPFSSHPLSPLEPTQANIRDRAWRRKTNHLHRSHDQKRPFTAGRWTALKNWKHLYTSSLKRSRARQLKIEYPRISNQQRRLNAEQDFWNTSD